MSDEPILWIDNLHVKVADEEPGILKVSTCGYAGAKVHALMGPNGSGKSTLAKVLMGQPGYLTTAGKLFFDGRELLDYITPDVVHVMVDGRIGRAGPR